MQKFDLQQCEIVRLSQNTTIRNFDCDNLDLNEFLLEKAKIYSVELLATFLNTRIKLLHSIAFPMIE